jgi:hypothetical protein
MIVKALRQEINGLLIIDKPLGFSSNQALSKIKWLYNPKKAGHTGTLDPLATGLLPVCLGEATKFSSYLFDANKTYEASIKLGFTSSTGDAEGSLTELNIDTFPNKTQDFKAKSAGFKGESQFVIRNVPSFSQNNLHPVEAYHLMEWIRHSLLKEDPKILSIDKSITALKESLESVAHVIKNAAENPIVNERGIIITGKQADQKRQARYDKMLKSKHEIRSQLEDTEADRRQIYNIKYDEIQLSATFLKKNEWKVESFGEQKEYYENILLNKSDWNTTFLHAYPIDLDPQLRSLDSEYLVDIGCISVERVEHGFGCYHRPSHISSAQYDQNAHGKRVISYHGTYEDGLHQGLGFMFTDSYIYGGGFEKRFHHGKGTIIHKDGDVIRSEFGLNSLSSGKANGNRYARGLSNGKGSITFADGAFYKGDLQNGIISGKGIYIGANG